MTRDSSEARAGGRIAFIHQDLGLIDWMTVAENIAFAQGFPRRLGLIDWRRVEATARASLALVAEGIDPGRRVQTLTRTEKSLVAIARALGARPDILVLDEPTASLPQAEVEGLFRVLRGLKSRGVSMIYVSHRLDEVYAIADRLAVLRDGRLVAVQETKATEPEALVRLIIGRPPESLFVRPPRLRRRRRAAAGGRRDRRCRAGRPGRVRAARSSAWSGCAGAGQELVGRALFGLLPLEAGTVRLDGAPCDLASPPRAIGAGIGFVAADRNADLGGRGPERAREHVPQPRRLAAAACWPGAAPPTRRPRPRCWAAGSGCGRTIPRHRSRPCPAATSRRWCWPAGCASAAGCWCWRTRPRASMSAPRPRSTACWPTPVQRGLAVVLVSTDVEEVAQICHRAVVFRDGRIVAEIDEAGLSVERLVHAVSLAPDARETVQ